MTPLLIPLKAAAELLACSPDTLRRRVYRGEIEYTNFAGIKFTQRQLDEFIERRTVGVRGGPELKVKHGPLKWVRCG